MARALLLAAASLLPLHPASAYAFFSTGTTVNLNGVAYFVPPDAVGRVSGNVANAPGDFGLLPVTLVNSNSYLRLAQLEALIDGFSEVDVFQHGFL